MKGTNCLQSLCYNSPTISTARDLSSLHAEYVVRRVRESHKVPPMRLNFISYCRLLPPREIAKSFSANGMIGRGGGDRILI